MIIVSYTSTVTNLIQIGELDLLRKLYGKILIPKAVLRELSVIEGQNRILQDVEWIVTRSPTDQKLIRRLLTNLDLGESEAIALAMEQKLTTSLLMSKPGEMLPSNSGSQPLDCFGYLQRRRRLAMYRQYDL